jgi:hypothetical protein
MPYIKQITFRLLKVKAFQQLCLIISSNVCEFTDSI